jgi:hypothetical protein
VALAIKNKGAGGLEHCRQPLLDRHLVLLTVGSIETIPRPHSRASTAKRPNLSVWICMLMLLSVWTGQSQQSAAITQQTDRHWSGLNPFHAPSRTTDYYGSGDINLDGSLTSEDLGLVSEMIAGARPANVRADVDGNGVIDSADLALLEAALHGGILPGWWNRLSTPDERASWIRRVMAIDFNQMVNNREADSDWGCANFATRCFLRFTPQVLDPANSLYESYGIAQNTFNLPAYVAVVTAPGFGHSLNAILIGDDPAAFTNWFFLDPETGVQALPGAWDLPWGAQVQIQRPDPVNAPYHSSVSLVNFQLSQPVVLTLAIDANLLPQRPVPDPTPIHNNPNIWQPVILPEGSGMVLFNKNRDDLLRSTELHLLTNLSGDPNTAPALLPTGGFHRLLGTAPASLGNYHLLWLGRTNRQQQLYYGKLEAKTGLIREQRVVATNILQGRLLGISTNEVFIFYPTEAGLTCVQRKGDQWGQPETVLQWTTPSLKISSPSFAVTTTSNQEPRVLWSDETTQDGAFQTTIFESQRDNGWQPPQTVGVVDGFIPTLEVARDSKGTTHLVYANTWYPAFECYSDTLPAELWQVVRGTIIYRRRDQSAWGKPQTVSTNSFWPTITISRSDEIFLGWEADQAGRVVPVWTDYSVASTPQAVATGGTPYHPAITEVGTGALILSWSEVSQWGSTANYQAIRDPETISIGIAAGPAGVQINWRSRSGGTFQVEYAGATEPASWQPLGATITTVTNCGSLLLPMEAANPVRFYRVKKL